MAHFFVNNFAQSDGSHEVHAVGCKRMPADKRYLGNFYNIAEAVMEARKDFWQSSCCDRCAGFSFADEDTAHVVQLTLPIGS